MCCNIVSARRTCKFGTGSLPCTKQTTPCLRQRTKSEQDGFVLEVALVPQLAFSYTSIKDIPEEGIYVMGQSQKKTSIRQNQIQQSRRHHGASGSSFPLVLPLLLAILLLGAWLLPIRDYFLHHIHCTKDVRYTSRKTFCSVGALTWPQLVAMHSRLCMPAAD